MKGHTKKARSDNSGEEEGGSGGGGMHSRFFVREVHTIYNDD